MDVVFGVRVNVIGVVANKRGYPQIATSQPWIDGVVPHSEETSEWLAEQDFHAVGRAFHDRGGVPVGSAWYRPNDNVLMGDALPRNFIKTPEGIIVPIDVSLTLVPTYLMPSGSLIGA